VSSVVLQTEELSPAAQVFVRERCELVVCTPSDPAFDAHLARASALIVRTYTIVDEALLAKAPLLRVVGRAGVGLTNIDLAACRARGIEVVHTPDANTQAVAELVLAFVLDSYRPRAFIERAIDAAEWRRVRNELIAPRQLSELHIGILGLGRVGSRVAQLLTAVGSRVSYCDLLEIDPARRSGASPARFEQLMSECDVVSVHVDDRATNRHLINATALAHLKPDATIINTSRGMVVDHAALASWLAAHPAARAILDVHEPEPITAANPLLGLANAHLTPHIGAATRAAHEAMSWVVRDVVRVLGR
jgi:phosphoglycerate dehydrogenase-like enzyme